MKRQFFSYAQKYVDGAKSDVSGNKIEEKEKRSTIGIRWHARRGVEFV